MLPLCRHILHDGRLCQQASVNGSYYCRHHQNQNAVVAKIEPKPDPWGLLKPLPFVPVEDHAGIQLNLFIVLQALNDKRIDNKLANTYNRILRNCQLNLEKMEASRAAHADAEVARRVILTPEGQEIAAPREKLEKDESPIHYKDCPCQRCAEQFRGAAPEQHHADCKCGLCEPRAQGSEHRAQESVTADEVSGVAAVVENEPEVRAASAHALRSADTLDPIQKEPNYDKYIYGDEIAKHEAQHAARVRAALEAGLEPPEHKPWDTSIKAAEHERERQEWKAGIDQRRKEAIDKWNAEHPEDQKEFKPFLTWGEEHDLKLAQMKKLREEEAAKLREQALPA